MSTLLARLLAAPAAGVTAEYGLIALGLSAGILVTVAALATRLVVL